MKIKSMDSTDNLYSNDFRVTPHRKVLLEFFMTSNRAFSHRELEIHFEGKIDRVSIYRILNSFIDAQILSKISDSTGKNRFVFDYHKDQSKNNNTHLHFKCKACNDVIELPQLPEQYLDQLKNLNIDRLNLLAEGTCNNCENKNQ